MNSDFELRIQYHQYHEKGPRLSFHLRSNIKIFNYFDRNVGEIEFHGDPEFYAQQLFSELDDLTLQAESYESSDDTNEAIGVLQRIGQKLYADLFPPLLKDAYRNIRRKIKHDDPFTILIITDDPWIPWELVKPYAYDKDRQEIIDDDPFLCESFLLTRWLVDIAPPTELEVQQATIVVPPSNLDHTAHEEEYFQKTIKNTVGLQVQETLRTVKQVRDGLQRDRSQIWHFACHGSFESRGPDNSAIHLEGGSFRAGEVFGPIETGIAQTKPFIMLNACHTARYDYTLTGLGGWAQRLTKAGASVFIGAQWMADDELAAIYTQVLYDELWRGRTLAQASHTARITIRERAPANPTWLAYAVYGNPHFRFILKKSEETSFGSASVEAIDIPIQNKEEASTTELPSSTPILSVMLEDSGVLVLTIEEALRQFVITIGWQPSKNGFTHTKSHIVTYRISREQLLHASVAAQNTLYQVTWMPSYRMGLRGKFADRREALYQCAVAGNKLYTVLFFPDDIDDNQLESLRRIREWINMTYVNDSSSLPHIRILSHILPESLPWTVFYPYPVEQPSDVDHRLFWGCRYRLEILTPRLQRNTQIIIPDRDKLEIVGGLYTFRVPTNEGVLDVTKNHVAMLQSIQGRKKHVKIDLREQFDQTIFKDFLQDSDVIYMFCHARGLRFSDTSLDYESISNLKDIFARLAPEVRAKYGDLIKLQSDTYSPNDPNINDSWFKFNRTLLPLRMLEQWDLRLDRGPLIIISEGVGSSFVPFFSKLGARGLIFAETPMLAIFAAAFGHRLMQRLADGEEIGQILPSLRTTFIEEERNVLGLCYAHYGATSLAF